jgi:hypothetical protein
MELAGAAGELLIFGTVSAGAVQHDVRHALERASEELYQRRNVDRAEVERSDAEARRWAEAVRKDLTRCEGALRTLADTLERDGQIAREEAVRIIESSGVSVPPVKFVARTEGRVQQRFERVDQELADREQELDRLKREEA